MAPRRRMLDPTLWSDEGFSSLTPRQQLLFIGLFSNADDEGRLEGTPGALKLKLPAVYGATSVSAIAGDLEAVLHAMTKLRRYAVDGRPYLEFSNWTDWQTVQKPTPSRLPAPPWRREASATLALAELSSSSTGALSLKGREEKGKEKKGSEGKGTALARPIPPPCQQFHSYLDGKAYGYDPNDTFLEKVAQRFGHLDLGTEALKMLDWLRRHNRRACNQGFILNWLRRAEEDASARRGHAAQAFEDVDDVVAAIKAGQNGQEVAGARR